MVSVMTRLLAVAASLLAAAFMASPAFAAGLEAFKNRARPVIVFAPAPNDPAALKQLEAFRKDRAAFAERDMTVFVVTPDGVTTLAGGRAPSGLDGPALRSAYGIKDGAFAVLLIGKDGLEKYRAADVVTPDALTDLVDQMPMRKKEQR